MKRRPIVIVVACAAMLGGQYVLGQDMESDVLLSADIGSHDKYILRGMNLTNDPVVQPSLTLGYGGVSANIWANIDLTDANDNRNEANELDYALDYSFIWNELALSLGVVYYTFPNTDFGDTFELYMVAGLDILLSPTFTVYRDVDEADGSYATLKASHSFPLPTIGENISSSLDVEGTVGYGSSMYNDYYFTVRKNVFTDTGVAMSLPLTFSEHLLLTATASYTSLLDDELRDAMENDDNLMFGIVASIAM